MNNILIGQIEDLIVGDTSTWNVKIHPKELKYENNIYGVPIPVYPIVTFEYFSNFYNTWDYKLLRIDLGSNYIYAKEM